MKIQIYSSICISFFCFFFSFQMYSKKEKLVSIIEKQDSIKYDVVSVMKTSRPSGKSSNKGHVLVLDYNDENYTIDVSFNQYEKLIRGEYISLYYNVSKDTITSEFDIGGRNRAIVFMVVIGFMMSICFVYLVIKMKYTS